MGRESGRADDSTDVPLLRDGFGPAARSRLGRGQRVPLQPLPTLRSGHANKPDRPRVAEARKRHSTRERVRALRARRRGAVSIEPALGTERPDGFEERARCSTSPSRFY
jgi:hypothetical protein